MSEPPQDDDLLRSGVSQEISNDENPEEILRELEHDELYQEISGEIAKFGWKIVEEIDPETGLKRHVLINEYGHLLWRIDHGDKRVAALVVQAFVVGALQARDEAREYKKELFDKLERWRPTPSGEVN